MTVLMRIGDHQFTIDDLNYQKFTEDYEARWKEHFTAGGGHVDHFLGEAPRAITLTGILFPESYGGMTQAQALGEEAGKGQPLQMYSLEGRSFGAMKFLSLTLSSDIIGKNAQTMQASYDLTISKYGAGSDRNPLMNSAGSFLGRANTLISAANTLATIGRTLF